MGYVDLHGDGGGTRELGFADSVYAQFSVSRQSWARLRGLERRD